MNFLKNHVIKVVEATAAAAQTALESDVVDLKDYDGVTFVVLTGDVASGSVLGINIEHGDLANGSDMADTTLSASYTATGAADADSKVLAVEMASPSKRYCRAVVTRTTADAAIGGVLAILHGAKRLPITQDATVLDSEFKAAPATA